MCGKMAVFTASLATGRDSTSYPRNRLRLTFRESLQSALGHPRPPNSCVPPLCSTAPYMRIRRGLIDSLPVQAILGGSKLRLNEAARWVNPLPERPLDSGLVA